MPRFYFELLSRTGTDFLNALAGALFVKVDDLAVEDRDQILSFKRAPFEWRILALRVAVTDFEVPAHFRVDDGDIGARTDGNLRCGDAENLGWVRGYES